MYGIELDEYSTLQSSLAALFMMLLEILIIIQVSFNILFLYSCLQLSNSFFSFFLLFQLVHYLFVVQAVSFVETSIFFW